MANENDYVIGEETTVTGVLTSIGDNAGSPEYTVAVVNEDSNRPLNIPPAVAPQASASHSEVLKLNAEREEEVRKESEKANEELADNDEEPSDQVKATDSPKEIREKTVTPDPARTPAGNATAKPAAKTNK